MLPPFDSIGAGQGQGQGRKSSGWAEPQRIIDQSVWVLKLLQMYRTSEEIYLPLVMLGYPIPPDRVHRALSEPLTASVSSIEAEAKAEAEMYGDCNIEDAIGNAAYSFSSEMEPESGLSLLPSQDILEAIMNVFLNPTYNLNDAPFEDAVCALEDWNRDLATKLQHLSGLRNESEDHDDKTNPATVDNFLVQASLVKQYLSLHQLKQAVEEASEADLQAMLCDVKVLREILLLIGRMVTILSREVPRALKTHESEMLPALFGFGRLVMWADLSLRRNGFANLIDQTLPKALEELQNEFDSKLEQECAAASPAFGLAIAELARNFKSNLKQHLVVS